jgi:hypothetical protein
MPIGINIQIQSIKTSVSDKEEFLYVKKIGRTTYLTQGLIQDKLVQIRTPIIKKKNKKKPQKRPKRFALRAIGFNKQAFSKLADFILVFYFVFL